MKKHKIASSIDVYIGFYFCLEFHQSKDCVLTKPIKQCVHALSFFERAFTLFSC